MRTNSIKIAKLLERNSKSCLEEVHKTYGLWGKDIGGTELHGNKEKTPLKYPIKVVFTVVFEDEVAYFAYKEDFEELVLNVIAYTGDTDPNSHVDAFELLDDSYRVLLNNADSEYFKGTLGDIVFNDCEKEVIAGVEVAVKPKEIHTYAFIL